nr:MAG TPA: hypothetical protein [Caudoviricetes sp.]
MLTVYPARYSGRSFLLCPVPISLYCGNDRIPFFRWIKFKNIQIFSRFFLETY